ncbi:MAG: SDR family oxidoreductase [Solobacterium sp.]|nr:SDR family oxidoreductase [Solobacterium sp.]
MTLALITGGSEGIGLELAKCFARDGTDLILTARDMEKLQKAKQLLEDTFAVDVTVIGKDLSLPHSAAELYEELKHRKIDYVINNAGLGTADAAWRIPPEQDEAMINVNITAVTVLTSLFLRDMLERNSGTIMNVASTGAFLPGPYIASYYASKAYVLRYTEAVAEEVRGSGVHVCCLCPGPAATSFYRKSRQSIPAFAMKAEDCAVYAYEKMKSGQTVIIPGMINRLSRLVPKKPAMYFVKKMKKKKDG